MNKYLIPLIITTGIGIYYFCNTKINNNIKIIESKEINTDKTGKNIIKLETILESNELNELEEINELKQIKDKSKYQIVVYKKPDGWEIVD
jgi:hypothetical protein